MCRGGEELREPVDGSPEILQKRREKHTYFLSYYSSNVDNLGLFCLKICSEIFASNFYTMEVDGFSFFLLDNADTIYHH